MKSYLSAGVLAALAAGAAGAAGQEPVQMQVNGTFDVTLEPQ